MCAAAWDLSSLIAFRAAQSLGAGLILPALMTLLTLRIGAPLGTTTIALVLQHALTTHPGPEAFTIAFWTTIACAALPVPVACTLRKPRDA